VPRRILLVNQYILFVAGLLNFSGNILWTLFGRATVADIHSLHDTLDELQSSTSDIHSLTSQVTYIKKLDTATKVNAHAIANFSAILKDIVVQSYDKFQVTARDILWLSYTLHGQSELYTTELELLQMFQQVSELLEAVQSVLQGKLPIHFIKPVMLQNILRYVSLHLPEGYELVAGTRMDNIHLSYELAMVTVVGNVHGIKIIVNVPLKTASQQFTLYKIIGLPSRMSDNNFVKYSIDFPYFGIDDSHRDSILLTEAHRGSCTKSSITLCPADIAIYNVQTVTRESSLFFQDTTSNKLCRRNLLFDY
jgi:hypothetical protein